jgi:long-chain acyl-CoA synthetase
MNAALHLSLAAVLHDTAARRPDSVAVVDGDAAITYGELSRLARAQAAALVALGVEPGDRVALMAPNTLGFVAAYHAVLTCGAVVVPLAPMLVGDEVAHVLSDAGARLVLVDPGQRDSVLDAAVRCGADVLALDELAGAATTVAPLERAVARGPLDPAVVFYTSGTTGRPKGAVLAHVNLVLNCFVNAFIGHQLRRDDVVLACLPLFHTFGQTVALNAPFLVGARVVLQARFDAAQALELMRRHGVTVLLGVPTMYVELLRHSEDGSPPPLRVCVSGGAALPVAVLERFQERFGCPIQEGYGLSETSPTATVNHLAPGIQPGTIGQAIWGVEAEVADPGRDDRVDLLATGEVGEIVLRGHNVFLGYLENPVATAAAVVDGWFRTGDLGTKDADGTLRIVDRKKDLIVRGGFNVYPREVEEVLARHPAIEQVAVIGVPDARYGEEVLAVVVLRDGEPAASADELLAWARERIAGHKRPRRVAFVDALPLGPSRKVLKRELRERFTTQGPA